MKNIATKYLIIGNSAGAIGAVEAIRSTDRDGSITIVSDEPYHAYSRPLISNYLAHTCTLENMLYRPQSFYEDNRVDTLLGEQIITIDPTKHEARLADGGVIKWQKLLISTGGTPISPPIKGADKDGVFTFTTLKDAKKIDVYIDKDMKAVVIGGGLIGLSLTEALVKRGIFVTIVELKDYILNVMLDESSAALASKALTDNGVNLATGHTVSTINGTSNVSSVTLEDGSKMDCDIVVIAIGVLPNTKLAGEAGLKLNRGIIVDRKMTTSNSDVYACGDAAESYDIVYEENRVAPIWPNAYIGGRVSGFNMAGSATEYEGGVTFNTLKYFGLDIATAGMVNPPDDSYEVLSAGKGNINRKLVLKDGVILGFIFIGGIDRAGIVFNLIKKRVNVSAFKDLLLEQDFGLSDLPDGLWRSNITFKDSASTE
jgi:NAD(P)H-nitrite reductase large subunit